MLEGLLGEQRLGVARAQQAQVAPADPHHLFDEIVPAARSGRKAARMQRIRPSRVTSVDVARTAGVSQSTVSLVLSGKAAGRISARTEEAVSARREELGYRPNVAARALRTGVARSVALVVPDITNPFFGRVLRGAQRAARRAGYTVVLVDIGNDRAWEARAAGAARRPRRRPAAVRGRASRPAGGRADPIEAGRPASRRSPRRRGRRGLALDHLLGLGHTRIAHVASSLPRPTFDLRRERWRAPLESVGADPRTRVRAVHFEGAARGGGRRCSTRATLHRGLLRRRHPRRRRLSRGARARHPDPART